MLALGPSQNLLQCCRILYEIQLETRLASHTPSHKKLIHLYPSKLFCMLTRPQETYFPSPSREYAQCLVEFLPIILLIDST